jgi:DNA replication ATP-dependent helicase Dna2
MPYLSKSTISRFFTSECEKQLRLVLSPSTRPFSPERTAEAMPPEQPPRPGLEQIAQAGQVWAEQKLAELEDVFGTDVLLGRRGTPPVGVTPRQVRFQEDRLASWIGQARAGQFLVECDFPVGPVFVAAMGIGSFASRFNLHYTDLRPDLIEVRAAGSSMVRLTPAGEVVPIGPGDSRRQLRVIDIKLTSEPGPSYFAEVTYYSLALAGWLVDSGLDSQFVVTPDAAVWPGSYQTSALLAAHQLRAGGVMVTDGDLRAALAEDLEEAPLPVFASRLRQFFTVELPRALATPWRDLPWHVSSKCRGCEYLGQRWPGSNATPDLGQCIPTAAASGHLSQIAFITRGASTVLRDAGVASVGQVAAMGPADETFDRHHGLRAQRVVITGRARALATRSAGIPDRAGTSATLPKWADLRIYLTADFDATSAITLAFGCKAFWRESTPFGSAPTGNFQRYPATVRVVAAKDLREEQKELLNFLNDLDAIITQAQTTDPQARIQIYLWDSLTYEHLTRVIGRHLPAILNNNSLRRLAWLFPPEQLVPNATAVAEPVITVVRNAVRSLLALPTPHHYSLLSTARAYHDPAIQPPWDEFRVPSLFEDPLSDQVPSERAHAIWNRVGGRYSWAQQTSDLLKTVKVRLDALEAVTRRLQADLRGVLVRQAPRVTAIRPPQLLNRVAADGQLLYAHAKLNAALDAQKKAQLRAMPPHEREARFASARGTTRLTGPAEATALARLNLSPAPDRWVYRLRPGSREVKCHPGEFLWAISPESIPGLLNRLVAAVIAGDQTLEFRWARERFARMEQVLQVSIRAIDRDAGLIVVDGDPYRAALRADLLAAGLVDLSNNVVLDPVAGDFFTGKLRATLEAIGNPPRARAHPLVTLAVGQLGSGARRSGATPVDAFLWDAAKTSATPVSRVLTGLQGRLQAAGHVLNPSQWRAWREALTRRLTLIWGPPGTGKSRTLQVIALGGVLQALHAGRPLRVLITSSNYTAIDNVLGYLAASLPSLAPQAVLRRLRSDSNPPPAWATGPVDVPTSDRQATAALHQQLTSGSGVSVVAGVPMQVHNLMVRTTGSPVAEFFDLLVVDEASQVDTANAVLALASAAPGASLVVAGDPLQLPPIHHTDPPLGLEHLVGPVFNFYARHHGIIPERLEENYRSTETIVELARTAGYPPSLRAASPKLRLQLLQPLPTGPTPPPDWPAGLYWTEEWSTLLDPALPATCFVYPDGTSGQWNAFEADAVVALARLLWGRLADQLDGEVDPATGMPRPAGSLPYGVEGFWQRGLGIVTPHRAQQSLIIQRLHRLFAVTGTTYQQIRDAVDTVERFQGQQRDIILASYAVGDPDTIADEVEFLHSLNRFNVLATRARAKLVVVLSEQVVHYMAGDIAVLRGSQLLKSYAETFCAQRRPMQLGVIESGQSRTVEGSFRWHS